MMVDLTITHHNFHQASIICSHFLHINERRSIIYRVIESANVLTLTPKVKLQQKRITIIGA